MHVLFSEATSMAATGVRGVCSESCEYLRFMFMPYACPLHNLIWSLPPVKYWTAIPLFDELLFLLQLLPVFLATFCQRAQNNLEAVCPINVLLYMLCLYPWVFHPTLAISGSHSSITVEPRYNEVLGTMKITLSGFSLYQGKTNKEI